MSSFLLAKLSSMTVYRRLLEKPTLKALCALLAASAQDAVQFCDCYGELCAVLHAAPAPHSLAQAIAADILTDDNPFSSACSTDHRPGAALFAAVELGKKEENKDKNIVVLLPDTGERYLSSPMFEE